MKIYLGLMAVLVLASVASGQNSKVKHADPGGLFTLTVPSTWKIGKATGPGMRFVASRGTGTNFEYLSVSDTVAAGSEKAPPSALVRAFLEGKPENLKALVETHYPDGKLISKGRIAVSKQEGFFVVAEGMIDDPSGKFAERTYSIQTLFEGKVIAIAFSVPSKKFDQTKPEFDNILASFVLRSSKP